MGLQAGLDLIEVSDVERSLRLHPARYLERVFTAREVADCRRPSGALDAQMLAGRFAAKEATLKALGATGEAIPWRCIEVLTAAGGALSLELSDLAARRARERGVSGLALSLTGTRRHAAAVVLADHRGEP